MTPTPGLLTRAIRRVLHWRSLRLAVLAIALGACTEAADRPGNPRILTMGDSLLAFHKLTGQSVSHGLETLLQEPVVDRSVSGARFFYILPITGSAGLNITRQFVPGPWEWVVLNGGGNDLLFGCACRGCDRRMNRLISEDGQRGAIPGFISKLRKTGARVIYVGYMRTPGVTSPVERCTDEGDVLEARIGRLAARDPGIHFVSNADLVPDGDRSFHALDLIHPSVKGSRVIAERIARIIAPAD